jgi:hypothetical protein
MSQQGYKRKHKLEDQIGKKHFRRYGMRIMAWLQCFTVAILILQKLSEPNARIMDSISGKKFFRFKLDPKTILE